MNKKTFILWLRGYFTTIDRSKPIDQILTELMNEIEELDFQISEKVIEKIIEKEIQPIIFPCPDDKKKPLYPFPVITMYGCPSPNYPYPDYSSWKSDFDMCFAKYIEGINGSSTVDISKATSKNDSSSESQ